MLAFIKRLGFAIERIPGESDVLAIGIPRRIGRLALAVRDAFDANPLGIHFINLLVWKAVDE